eukprot:7074989-Pyramimonas_sp.AAC.1
MDQLRVQKKRILELQAQLRKWEEWHLYVAPPLQSLFQATSAQERSTPVHVHLVMRLRQPPHFRSTRLLLLSWCAPLAGAIVAIQLTGSTTLLKPT